MINSVRRHIVEMCVAHSGILVPTVHGIDCFRELGAACLINAASVDPNVIESVGRSHVAGVSDLLIFHLFFLHYHLQYPER
jgi:hypothetical protein